MNILITGGAGYIGSHIVKQLGEKTDHDLFILDNLSTGFKDSIFYGDFEKVDICIEKDLFEWMDIFKERQKDLRKSQKIDCIIHMAAFIDVEESVLKPDKYFFNNIIGSYNIIKLAIENNIKNFIFSSSSAVNGYNGDILSPYGRNKKVIEDYLLDLNNANLINPIIFRYFNVAGASDDLKIGQKKQTKDLISNCVNSSIKNEPVKIFGKDYNTPDGTCIRDYIHVEDLARAHIIAIDYLKENNCGIFDIGSGNGYSVKSIIETFNYNNIPLKYNYDKRRSGDIPISKAEGVNITEKEMGFKVKRNLNDIIISHYNWKIKYDNINNNTSI